MQIDLLPTEIDDIKLIKISVFRDDRGFFAETFQARDFARAGLPEHFVQDNHSRSVKGVLRGFHYQSPNAPQGKLVRCTVGEILDVAVDLRIGSPTFGRSVSACLSAENMWQLYVPVGFGHAFITLSDIAEVQYKCTGFYNREAEGNIRWNDPDIDFNWPINEPVLSPRDLAASSLEEYIKNPAFIYGQI
ncbi:dTDP-4-dehydrorhamnose 3,5-epimerase [candidate division KSB1 bacterium]|nr:dTDP-4-dehydrorhamnose 3,5-epimerase [candidate division KSB1 bacterium]